MQNHPTMYHILYKPPHNEALVRADARTDVRMDGQSENSIPADKRSLRGYNNTLDLIITSLPDPCVDIHSSDRLSDHDIVSRTLKKKLFSQLRNIRGSYIDIRKVIMNLREIMRLNLQKKSTSMTTQILVRFKKISILLHLSFRICRMNISHQKLVVRFLQSHG